MLDKILNKIPFLYNSDFNESTKSEAVIPAYGNVNQSMPKPILERKSTVQQIREKYPQRLPVLCNKSKYSKNTPNIDKNKYLVPFDLTAAQFIYVIRKRMKLNPEVALFLFVGRMIPPGMTKMIYLYENYKNEDGFLYITYSTESTFGLL